MRFSARRHATDDAGGGPLAAPLRSMIDVVFLLLIYFMVTASFGDQERRLEATVRAESGAADETDLQPQILVVRQAPDGTPLYEIGSRRPADRASLVALLRQLPRGAGVVVRPADGVRWEHVAAAMQAVADAGFDRRSYLPGDGGAS